MNEYLLNEEYAWFETTAVTEKSFFTTVTPTGIISFAVASVGVPTCIISFDMVVVGVPTCIISFDMVVVGVTVATISLKSIFTEVAEVIIVITVFASANKTHATAPIATKWALAVNRHLGYCFATVLISTKGNTPNLRLNKAAKYPGFVNPAALAALATLVTSLFSINCLALSN